MKLFNSITSLTLSLFALTIFCSCEKQEGGKFTTTDKTTQALGEFSISTVGDVRIKITDYVFKRYKKPICEDDFRQFKVISRNQAFKILNQFPFPTDDIAHKVLRDLSNLGNSFVPILGRIRFGEQTKYILKLEYLSPHDNLPAHLGCSDGLFFDNVTITPWNDEDPDPGPQPDPASCLMFIGESGPCCSCSAAWTDTKLCNFSYNCPHDNCCDEDERLNPLRRIKEICHTNPNSEFWKNDMPIQFLEVGQSLNYE